MLISLVADELQPTDDAATEDLTANTEHLSLHSASESQTGEQSTLEGGVHDAMASAGASNQCQLGTDSQQENRTSNTGENVSRNTASSVEDGKKELSAYMSNVERTNIEKEQASERTDLDNSEESEQNEFGDGSYGNKSAQNLSRSSERNDGKVMNDPKLLQGDELIALLYAMHDGKEKVQDGVTTVGLVSSG